MVEYRQFRRLLKLTTPLGSDVLLLGAFSGAEVMSRPFSYRLEMYSTNLNISAKSIVGKNVTWEVQNYNDQPRYFNGFVSNFTASVLTIQDLRAYQAEVVPWTWFLTRTANCRIFQNMTVKDIIKKVFDDLGFTDYDLSGVKASYPTWEYCVQYRETAFNFVSRLMEHVGIFYFFKHDNGKHTLMCADQTGAYKDVEENQPRQTAGTMGVYHITQWDHQYSYTSGKWTHTDYNFETPSTNLLCNTQTVVDLPNVSKYELFDYPGDYKVKSVGQDESKVRMQEEEAVYDVVTGSSDCCTFTPGGKYTVQQPDISSEAGKSYVFTSVHHSAVDTSHVNTALPAEYTNTFTCIPASTTFRPPRATPRPVVMGPQTAVVVGPTGEEIYTDKYGRIKVQFFWDREGKKDENSSCWMRVTEMWAGKNWGIISTPRIGQEVVVDFLEGDPDRPLITGRVYNAEQMPPYTLPDKKNISGVKSNSTIGGGGYNELYFDDTKGQELINLHAQKDMNTLVLNNDTQAVVNDRENLVQNDQRDEVDGKHSLTVKTDRNEKVGGSESLNVTTNIMCKVGQVYVLDAGQEVHIKAGMTMVLEAPDLTIMSGGNFININPSGVYIVGTMVMINSGGSAGNGTDCDPTDPDPPKAAQKLADSASS